MIVHYFYCREYGAFHDLKLAALMEEDVWRNDMQEKSFKYIEEIRIFISNDMDRYHNATFKIDFGKDSCHGHYAKSRTELFIAMNDNCGHEYKPITKLQYLRLRKVALAIYQSENCMDFDLVAKKQDYTVRVLF